MYYNRPRNYRGQGSVGFMMPFLIIIFIGIIIVLGYKLWNAFIGDNTVRGAYMHIVEGSAQMRTWGTDQFFDLAQDSVIMQGDEISTSNDAMFIVEFLDGTIMRMGGGSDVTFEEVNFDGSEPTISLLMAGGKLWINKSYKDTGLTNVKIKAANMAVSSSGKSIFELEGGMEDAVRVFEGANVSMEILSEDGAKSVDTVEVGVGQQVVLTEEALAKYWQFQSPNVLEAISDEFKTTAWAVWNLGEDSAPSKFEISPDGSQLIKVEPQVLQVEEPATTEENKEKTTTTGTDTTTTTTATATKPLTAPTFASILGTTGKKDANGFYEATGFLVTIKGNVDPSTYQVVVNDYTLGKFKPGDKMWTYFANAKYGYMKEGENIYNVYAIDSSGKKSEKLEVKVIYKPVAAPAPAVTPTDTTTPAPATGN